MSNSKKTHTFPYFLNKELPLIVKAEGVYLYDDNGKRYIDGISGTNVSNIGHAVKDIADIVLAQLMKTDYVFRRSVQTPEIEEAAAKICETTNGDMDKVFFVSGGSEATESAVKIARKYHIDNGDPSKYRVISRWQSYHGATMGALSWTGFTWRRSDFTPYLNDFVHLPPTYCYRCWYGKISDTCNYECAHAMENEILCLGPDTVSAYITEPVSGHSLAGAFPPDAHFKRIREICDKHNVLLIFDEVMSGVGRTGKWYAYKHLDIIPDIIALAKGLGAGYYPVGAVAVKAKIADTIANNSGIYGSGHTYAGNPVATAVTSQVIDFMRKHKLVERCSEMGEYFSKKLDILYSHPTVGDIRGKGLLWGIEFVKDKKAKTTFKSEVHFSELVKDMAWERGLNIESSFGCDRGQAGDMILLGPPFIITKEQIDEMIEILDESLTEVEQNVEISIP